MSAKSCLLHCGGGMDEDLMYVPSGSATNTFVLPMSKGDAYRRFRIEYPEILSSAVPRLQKSDTSGFAKGTGDFPWFTQWKWPVWQRKKGEMTAGLGSTGFNIFLGGTSGHKDESQHQIGCRSASALSCNKLKYESIVLDDTSV